MMRRDLSLIRAILLEMERRSETDAGRPIVVEGYDDDTVKYHALLAIEGGLIEAGEHGSNGRDTLSPRGLTEEGRSFLDLARDEGTWNRTLQRCQTCIGSIPIDVFHTMLAHEAVMALGA